MVTSGFKKLFRKNSFPKCEVGVFPLCGEDTGIVFGCIALFTDKKLELSPNFLDEEQYITWSSHVSPSVPIVSFSLKEAFPFSTIWTSLCKDAKAIDCNSCKLKYLCQTQNKFDITINDFGSSFAEKYSHPICVEANDTFSLNNHSTEGHLIFSVNLVCKRGSFTIFGHDTRLAVFDSTTRSNFIRDINY